MHACLFTFLSVAHRPSRRHVRDVSHLYGYGRRRILKTASQRFTMTKRDKLTCLECCNSCDRCDGTRSCPCVADRDGLFVQSDLDSDEELDADIQFAEKYLFGNNEDISMVSMSGEFK